jgi:hypothetical protein
VDAERQHTASRLHCRAENGFGDFLISRLNRLPLPSFPLLSDITQAWEGEMRSIHQGFLGCGPVHVVFLKFILTACTLESLPKGKPIFKLLEKV